MISIAFRYYVFFLIVFVGIRDEETVRDEDLYWFGDYDMRVRDSKWVGLED